MGDDLAPAGLLEELSAGAPEPVVGVVGGHDEAVMREGWWGGWMTVASVQSMDWSIEPVDSVVSIGDRPAQPGGEGPPQSRPSLIAYVCVRTVKRDAALPIVRDPKDVRLLCGCVVQSNRSMSKFCGRPTDTLLKSRAGLLKGRCCRLLGCPTHLELLRGRRHL